MINFISILVLCCQSKRLYVTSATVSEYDGKLSESGWFKTLGAEVFHSFTQFIDDNTSIAKEK
jgi:hypothetical protein